ncbi:NRDE family protein [Shewanella algae]|uniref:NRDE family protein n=1 Tax=Shewanella algae TaxID=38313 RepID=UPI0031F5807B
MCILFLALDQHPDYPLILCANRDEFHHRPTAPAHFWPPQQQLLAGKDLQAGGTWLGCNRLGTVAGLTNIRQPITQPDGMRSRGELVLKALDSQTPIEPQWLSEHSDNYNPFNLVFGQGKHFWCYHSPDKSLRRLNRGFHAISNGALDDIWPKMARGEQALERLISQSAKPDIDKLLAIMRDETPAPDTSLPTTGVSLEWERRLSSIYIRHPEYGTRATSLIFLSREGQLNFYEARYDGKGRQLGLEQFSFALTNAEQLC